MNITRENNWIQAAAEMKEATECKTADRYHVDSLLNISEESSVTVSLHGIPLQSAWEQVVKGWNECPPLAWLFHLQNKRKPIKTGLHEYHCLLCIDANVSQEPEENHFVNSEPSETNCSLPEDNKDENNMFPPARLETPPVCPSEISCSDSEQDSFKYEKNPIIQAETRRVRERAYLHKLPDASPKLTYMKLAIQCPIMKEKGIINKFSVLPPMKGSGYPRGTRLRGLAASTLSSPDRLTAENRWYGLPLTGEGHVEGNVVSPGANAGAEVLEDSNRSLAAKSYQFPPSKRLSTFSIRLPKRFSSSLHSFEGTLSLATDHAGRRHIRAVNNYQRYNHKQTEIQLPELLGTRVSIQAMSHRIMCASHV